MALLHDPSLARRKSKRTLHSSQRTISDPFHLKMNSDDLPIYPTPQQATYTIPPSTQSPRRSQKPQSYSSPGHLQAPSQSAYGQHQGSVSYANNNPQMNSYNYQQQRYQPAQTQPPQQQYHQMQSAPPVQNYQGQNMYQNSYQAPLPQPHQGSQSTSNIPVSSPQYSNNHTISSPHAQRVSSASSHYSSSSPVSSGQHYSSAQPPIQQSARVPSHSTQQQQVPQSMPVQHTSSVPSTPQTSSRSNMSKKPPTSGSNRSREALDETSKLAQKQRLEAELRSTFERVDVNRSGRISVRELSSALVNFDNTGFQYSTVRLMIKLFTNANSGSASGLNFEQFVSLWKYLTAYKKLFVAADVNKSGDISFGEFQKIIEQIGYKLNVDLVLHLFQKFANKDTNDDGSLAVGKLKFDAFIESLVYLRKLTDIFKQYDKQLTGVATIDYSDFLFEISNLT